MAFDPHKPECSSSGFDPIGGLGCVCVPKPAPYVHFKQFSIASGPSRPQKTALFVPPPPPSGYYVEQLVCYPHASCWFQVRHFYDNVRHRSVKLPCYYIRECDARKAAKRVHETSRHTLEVRVTPYWSQTVPVPFTKKKPAVTYTPGLGYWADWSGAIEAKMVEEIEKISMDIAANAKTSMENLVKALWKE